MSQKGRGKERRRGPGNCVLLDYAANDISCVRRAKKRGPEKPIWGHDFNIHNFGPN